MLKKPLSFFAAICGSIGFFTLVTILGMGLIISTFINNYVVQSDEEE